MLLGFRVEGKVWSFRSSGGIDRVLKISRFLGTGPMIFVV